MNYEGREAEAGITYISKRVLRQGRPYTTGNTNNRYCLHADLAFDMPDRDT